MRLLSRIRGNERYLPLALVIFSLCIGIYLITTTRIIAKDGVTFIEYAKNLTVSPTSTILSQDQHPGYPFLILTAHKITNILHKGTSIRSWVYCAQSIALLFRLLTVVTMYFIGKVLVGTRTSFWAILLLIMLPKPAEYGSDALSDWPHMFFLSTGFLMLILGAISRRWWLFGFAGLIAGMGYMIRPECAQLVAYGFLWLVPQLLWVKRNLNRRRVMLALTLLLIGFLVSAGPYMKFKGAIFPKKHVGKFVSSFESYEFYKQKTEICSNNVNVANVLPPSIIRGLGKIVENVGDTLMWFFLPFLPMGLYGCFRRQNWYEPERFFIATVIGLNVFLMLWLYCKFGYMSGRHTLTLVVFTIFYIPVGLQISAHWLAKKCSKQINLLLSIKTNKQFWFSVLFITGSCICISKLIKPLHYDKTSYIMASEWLVKNTHEQDVIIVPDSRISFYAERKGVTNKEECPIDNVKYVVQMTKEPDDLKEGKEKPPAGMSKIWSSPINAKGGEIVIYTRK